MDDRTWYLAIGTLIAAVAVLIIDAALPGFVVPSGFWAVLSAILGFLTARGIVIQRKENGG